MSVSSDDAADHQGRCEQVLVKVSKTKLAVSTFWTLEKFDDRLLQMRELYQASGMYTQARANTQAGARWQTHM